MLRPDRVFVLLAVAAIACSSCSKRPPESGSTAGSGESSGSGGAAAGSAPEAAGPELAWNPFGDPEGIDPEILPDDWRAARELRADVGVDAAGIPEATRRLAEAVEGGVPNVEKQRAVRKDLRVLAVRLRGTRYGDGDLAALRRLPHLRWLDLSAVSPGGLPDAALAPLAGLTRLESLTATGLLISDGVLRPLEGLTRLRELRLAGTRVTDAGLRSVGRLTALVYLDLAGTKVTHDGLAALKSLTNLERLYLYTSPDAPNLERNTRVDPLKALPHLGQLTRLADASMLVPEFGVNPYSPEEAWGGMGDVPWTVSYAAPGSPEFNRDARPWRDRPRGDVLVHLRGMTRLTALDLRSVCCRDDDLRILAGLTGLERLSLSGSPVTAEGLKHLKGLPNLKVLNLRGTDVRDPDLAVLAEFPALTDVATPQTRVTEAGARAIEARKPILRVRVSRPDEAVTGRMNPDRRPEYMTADPPPPPRGPITGPPIFPDKPR